jgi:endonuclease/exonuclease/phosphatase (EEP) superfamily protein YafD
LRLADFLAFAESGGGDSLERRQMAEILAHQERTVGATPVLIAATSTTGRSTIPMRRCRSPPPASTCARRRRTRGPTSAGRRRPIDWIFVRSIAPLSGRVVDSSSASDHFRSSLCWNRPSSRAGSR